MTTVSYDPAASKREHFEIVFADDLQDAAAQKKMKAIATKVFVPQHDQGLHFSFATCLVEEAKAHEFFRKQPLDSVTSAPKMFTQNDPFLSDEHRTLSAAVEPILVIAGQVEYPFQSKDPALKKPLPIAQSACSAQESQMFTAASFDRRMKTSLPMEMPHDFLPAVIPFTHGVVHISKILGSGVYGKVYHAFFECSKTSVLLEVALKVNHIFAEKSKTLLYRESLLREAAILSELATKDVDDTMPVARFVEAFHLDEHRFCFLQKICSNDLYAILRQNQGRGVSFTSLCHITLDLLKGLKFLQDQNPSILHADIKPENVMKISDDSEKLRIVDFSVSMRGPQRNSSAREVVSRFYRPPEVVLGCPYDHTIDNWAVVCVLFEMYTGRPLFPAKDTNQLLNMLFEFLGPVPAVYGVRSAGFSPFFVPSETHPHHFELPPQMQIKDQWENRRSYFERKLFCKKEGKGSKEDLLLFKDFILHAFTWDPDDRPSVELLTQHPFYIKATEVVRSSIDVV